METISVLVQEMQNFFFTSLGAELESRSGRISMTRQATHREVESSAIISTVVTSLDLAFADQDLSNNFNLLLKGQCVCICP